MPNLDLRYYFDPELIIPSKYTVHDLEFWLRLQAWTNDYRPRLGPLTSIGLEQLMADPPAVAGLPVAEFWKIVGKLVSRVDQPSPPLGTVCESHVRAAYAPSLGHENNADALVDVLAHAPQELGAALATDSRCWSAEVCVSSCIVCISRVIDLYTEPGADLGHVLRRHFLDTAPDSFDSLVEAASALFPSITFSTSAWTHLNMLSGETRDNIQKIALHLGVLNDHAEGIWNTQQTTTDRQSQLGSHGVEASPENGNTRRSSTAMSLRTFDFVDRKIRCEWHTKLRPNKDRIYFALQDGRVYVGDITDHL